MWEWIFRFSTLCDDGFRLLLLLEFGSWFMRLIVSSCIWTALHLFANSALLDVLFSSYFFRYFCYWNVRWCYWISGQKVKRLQQWGNDSSIQNLTLDINQLQLIFKVWIFPEKYLLPSFYMKTISRKIRIAEIFFNFHWLCFKRKYWNHKNESNQWTTIK